jgi:hypothetical protein
VRLEELGEMKNFIHLIESRTRDPPAFSIVLMLMFSCACHAPARVP